MHRSPQPAVLNMFVQEYACHVSAFCVLSLQADVHLNHGLM